MMSMSPPPSPRLPPNTPPPPQGWEVSKKDQVTFISIFKTKSREIAEDRMESAGTRGVG